MYRLFCCVCTLAALAACGGRTSKQQAAASAGAARQAVFMPPAVPAAMPPEQAGAYLREHYWDRFDFADTLFLRQADTMQMTVAFAQFVALLGDATTDPKPMQKLMQAASTSRPMLDYFAYLAAEVLHDPNSPLRNDEFYIPVLETQLASSFYDEYERMGPEYELHLAQQNRIGHRANDIRYTLASGALRRLYDLKADYVLLFINNPGCPMCRDIREAIVSSPLLTEAIGSGRLKVLALYPDEELGEWEAYRPHIPAEWINAYDKGCRVRETGSYDLSAIPALYLLDRNKTVLVKDSTDVGEVERAILRREAL